jgi:hypothetical protein
MKRKTRCIPATLLIGCLSVGATRAQVTFEETEFAGWTTSVFGGLERTVSGVSQPSGGNPDANYLVRHRHENFATFATLVPSVSLSPIELAPAELGLSSTPLFSVDLQLDVALGGEPSLAPTLYWAPVLEQGETLYRYRIPANLTLSRQLLYTRVAFALKPGDWLVPPGRPALDLEPGAPPVRVGLVLQSDVVVGPGAAREARIRIDNLRIESFTGDLPKVSLVAVPSPLGGHVVFAPPECFDGDRAHIYELKVYAEMDRDWEGCFDAETPNLLPVGVAITSQFCFRGQEEPFNRSSTLIMECTDRPPSKVELLAPPSQGTPAVLGSPSLARVEPCLVRVAGGDLSCSEIQGVCAAELAFGLLCSVFPEGVPCYLPDFETSGTVPRASAAQAAASDAIDTLHRVRDEVMASSPAGRYYRDLYDAFSPELRDLLLSDLRILRDVLAAAPPWIAALGELVDGGGDQAAVTPAMVTSMLAIFDRFESRASPALREVFRRERARLRLEEAAGHSIDDLFARIVERGAPPACATSDTALCLQGGRFRVEVTWTDFKGNSGAGHAVPLSSDSGYFWFFNLENVELGLKVLDGRAVNGRYWVFYGALSNVEYTVLVTDTATGALRAYRNPSRVFASVGDTGAFVPDGAPRAMGETVEGSESTMLARLTATASDTVRQGWRRLREGLAREPAPPAHLTLSRPAAVRASPLFTPRLVTRRSSLAIASGIGPRATCSPSANALCLAGGRFRVEVEWRDFRGRSGVGTARPLTSDTGSFWFFDAANVELFVKVLDARSINGHFWVFFGALSNVEYTLRVTDTSTGAVRIYHNPAGTFASRGDVEAF